VTDKATEQPHTDRGRTSTGHMAAPADRDDTVRAAQMLRDLACYYVRQDCNYTRDLGDIVHIRRKGDYSGYDHPFARVRRALENFNPSRDSTLDRMMFRSEPDQYPYLPRPLAKFWALGWRGRVSYAKRVMKTEKHLPDGTLDGGGVIVYSEETGEYLELVQPQVGALIAEFLQADPDHPHARKIAAAINHFGAPRPGRYCLDDTEETSDDD